MKSYTDFVIRLEALTEERVLIRVASCQGEASQEGELSRAIREGNFPADLDQAKVIGTSLFDLVFFPAALALWERTRGEAGTLDSEGVRVKLQFDLHRGSALPLAGLPWELLFHEPSGGFLALDCRTPIVRYLDLPMPPPRVAKDQPWNVLVVAPRPSRVPPLDREAELSEVLPLWEREDTVSPVVLQQAGASEIRQALTNQERIHAVHFLGHGIFDEGTGWGGLVLEGQNGRAQKLLGPRLTDLFKGLEPPVVAVLNACNTGQVGGVEPFAGAGTALVRAGVPSVVAMQGPIRDSLAILFSKHLFSSMQAGHPVDRAMSEARLHLHLQFPESCLWAIPTLFSRVSYDREPSGRDDGARESPEQSLPALVQAETTISDDATIYRQSQGAEDHSKRSLLGTKTFNAKKLDIGKADDNA